MNANDTNKLISALQSFADRLKNDPVAGTIYEGDWDTLIDAQTYLKSMQYELDMWKKEPLVKLLKETDYVNVVATKE